MPTLKLNLQLIYTMKLNFIGYRDCVPWHHMALTPWTACPILKKHAEIGRGSTIEHPTHQNLSDIKYHRSGHFSPFCLPIASSPYFYTFRVNIIGLGLAGARAILPSVLHLLLFVCHESYIYKNKRKNHWAHVTYMGPQWVNWLHDYWPIPPWWGIQTDMVKLYIRQFYCHYGKSPVPAEWHLCNT